MDAVVEKLNKTLKKTIIPSHCLLDQFVLIDERSRLSMAYNDPIGIPTYFYLGREITPHNVIEFGLRAGLTSGCFFTSCRSVTNFLGFQQQTCDDFYSPRLAVKNIRHRYKNKLRIYVGSYQDDLFQKYVQQYKWDLVMITDEVQYDVYMAWLQFVWTPLADDGLIIIDNLNSNKVTKRAYLDFCKIHNSEVNIIESKYGIGLVRK